MLNCITESKLVLLFPTPKPWVFLEGNAVFPSFQEQIFCEIQQAMWSSVTSVPVKDCRLSVSLVREWSLSQELPTGWVLKLLVEKGTAEKQTSGMLKTPSLLKSVISFSAESRCYLKLQCFVLGLQQKKVANVSTDSHIWRVLTLKFNFSYGNFSAQISFEIIRESFQLTLHEVRITKLFVSSGEVLTKNNTWSFETSVQSMSCNETSTLKKTLDARQKIKC